MWDRVSYDKFVEAIYADLGYTAKKMPDGTWKVTETGSTWELDRDIAHNFDKLFCSEIGIKY